ncbi:MAG: methylmalonyl Co-A mutase-associated GTPase MeaB [Bacillota bacterium]
MQLTALIAGLLCGDKLSLARAITMVENRETGAVTLLKSVYPHTGRARVIGVTGAPGVGKSTLVDGLAQAYTGTGASTGIVAVDPTSPFSGGAILGDRVRMRQDPSVFIRSLATRGQLGGLSRATADVVKLMDGSGRDPVIVETVGAGQSEVDVVKLAHTVVVVVAPGQGDEVQAAKAGIMEIADVFAVNKADREGADRTARELELMLDTAPVKPAWRPPVVMTVARDGTGLQELRAALDRHREFLTSSGELQRRARQLVRAELLSALTQELSARVLAASPALDELVGKVLARQLDPHTAVECLLARADQGKS